MKFTFPTALFVILLIIKLLQPTAITWFWVFAPLWMGFTITILTFLIIALCTDRSK